MVPQVMHIGASAALPWNLASRSCDEWISMPTSRAEAAPALEMTSPACSADLAAATGADAEAAGATGAAALEDFSGATGECRTIDCAEASRSSS